VTTHDPTRFRELISLDESNDGFAFILSVIEKNAARFDVAFLRDQIL